jgi:signal transduction histidine kinase
MEKLNVSALVIDDQEDMLMLCSRVLAETVTDVTEASSCNEARTAFHKKSFDLVLTDINIDKDGDGVMMAQEIKNVSPDTKVIMMTADPTLETAIGGLKSGVMEYIIKPFSPEYLGSVVRNAFEKAKLSSELEREKAMKQELEAAYSQLKASESAKDAFLSRVNHELRTPLSIALASSELLGLELKSEKELGIWKRSDRALRSLQLSIGELLLYSGLLKGDLKIDKKETDLLELLNRTSAGLKFLYDDMAITVAISSEGEPYPLQADPELLGEAFKQLLVNGVKFNKKGGSISVRAHYLPDHAAFSFSDTGPGVRDEDMPHIFDSFFQVADYLTREVGGIGLGLATVKQIAERHGGSVAAQKNPAGSGMMFIISLPRKPAV